MDDNKKYVILREIMNLVAPSDIKNKQISTYFHQEQERILRKKGKTIDTMSYDEFQQYQDTVQKIQGGQFYDADVDNEISYRTHGRRAHNKERTKDVLQKYYSLQAEKEYRKKRKKAMLKIGLDPKDPVSDQII